LTGGVTSFLRHICYHQKYGILGVSMPDLTKIHLLTMIDSQLAGQRKRDDGSEGGGASSALSSLTGLRPSYW